MNERNKSDQLDEDLFLYRKNKESKVFIMWKGRQIMVLKGNKADLFLNKIRNKSGREAQLVMAKITGNFKH